MKDTETRQKWQADLLLLVCLGALLIMEVLAWRVVHRGEEELQQAVASGSSAEKVWAYHVQLNRGEPQRLEHSFVEDLLASEEALVRELAMTSDVRRLSGRKVQRRYLAESSDPGENLRGRYYMKRFGRPVKRSFIRDYFRSLEE
jgi:hypothetical protein